MTLNRSSFNSDIISFSLQTYCKTAKLFSFYYFCDHHFCYGCFPFICFAYRMEWANVEITASSFDNNNNNKLKFNAQNSLISSVELWNWFAMTWRTFDRYKCTPTSIQRNEQMSKHTNRMSGWMVEQTNERTVCF